MIIGWIFLYKEYFIPSLFAIIDRFSCTEDVAALVLAIGTLLPVLIHEVLGALMAYQEAYQKYDFGKIVGSINFNLLIYLAVAGIYVNLYVYRVFRPDLIYFEDLAGQLKTTFWSKCSYLCIPELWAFVFHQSVSKKVT